MRTKEKRQVIPDKVRGAGRPLRGDRKRIRLSFTLHPSEAEWLKKLAATHHKSCSEALDDVLQLAREHLTPKPEISAERIQSRVRISVPLTDIATVCRKYHVKKLSVFGSALTDQFSPESDVDLLAEFDPSQKIGLFEIVNMANDLSPLFNGRKLDLRTPGDLSRYFRDEVLRKAELIYVA